MGAATGCMEPDHVSPARMLTVAPLVTSAAAAAAAGMPAACSLPLVLVALCRAVWRSLLARFGVHRELVVRGEVPSSRLRSESKPALF